MCCAKAIDAISGCLNENVMFGGGKGNNILHLTSSLPLSSVAQSCLTLCDPIDCSTPGLTSDMQTRVQFWESFSGTDETSPVLTGNRPNTTGCGVGRTCVGRC